MKKKKFTFVAIFIIAVVVSACTEKSENILVEKNKMNASPKDETLFVKEYNADFEQIALAVSQLIATNSKFKQILQQNVAEKFDGDYNILISQLIKNYPNMEDWFKEKNIEIRDIVEKYPLIQIAIPINFNKFSDNDNVKIVFLPIEFDDTKTKTVQGFNIKGNRTEYTINSNPDYPVVVISENERVELCPPRHFQPIALPPTNLTATAHPDGIMLNWENYNIYEISGYKIYRTDGISTKTYMTFGRNKTYFFDYDVEIEKTYTYYVVAVRYFICKHYISEDHIYDLIDTQFLPPIYSEPSNTADAVIYVDYPTQTLFINNGNNNTLVVSWGHLTYNPQSIELWRKIEGEQSYSQIATLAGNINNYTEQSPNKDKAYQYKVRAIKQNGNYSEWSNSISTYAGERNTDCNLKIKNLKFETLADLEILKQIQKAMQKWCCMFILVILYKHNF